MYAITKRIFLLKYVFYELFWPTIELLFRSSSMEWQKLALCSSSCPPWNYNQSYAPLGFLPSLLIYCCKYSQQVGRSVAIFFYNSFLQVTKMKWHLSTFEPFKKLIEICDYRCIVPTMIAIHTAYNFMKWLICLKLRLVVYFFIHHVLSTKKKA